VHKGQENYDSARTKFIYKQYGVRIIRFWNGYLFKNPDAVLRKIFNYIPKIEYSPDLKRRRRMSIKERYGVNEMAFKNRPEVKKKKRGSLRSRGNVVKGPRKTPRTV
jgi:hypothetical protein